ncbi:MAG: AAA family ATPase [Acidimicrobiales bacterium]
MPTRAGFVGRQSELSVLDERLAAARTGHPQVVYVEGEAGAGKSTLLSRFLGSLSGAVVLEVGGDEAETFLTYGVVDQLLPGLSTEPGADPMAVGARLLDLFDNLQAGGQVVVLAIDDLHWADRPSARAVLFALRRLRGDKVLAILATRSGGLADPSWARFVAGDSRVTHVRLGGLSSGDLTDLARALGLGALSPRAASRLATHTRGNALYCRALLDEIGVVGLSAGDGGLPAPRELSALILARVSTLPPTTQAFLAAASVLGQHAPASLIVSVAQLPEARHDMDAAIGAGLLREDLARSELSFTHPLYRAAIYDDLSPAARRELQARAAAVVVGGQRLAHRVAAAVGPDEQLAGELESAAVADADLGDLVGAAWAFERSAYLSLDAGQRERRLLEAAGAQLLAADNAGAARTLAACRASSARRDALSGLLGVYTGSPDAGNRLLAAWESHDPGTEQEIGARAATSLANWMVISGRSEEALMWADRAVDGTLPGSALHTRARVAQAFAMSAAGRSPDGLAVLGLLPASGNEVQAAATDAVIMRGMLKLYVDDLAGAIADLGVAAARLRNGLPASYPGMCLSALSDAHFRRGDWDAAVVYAQLATPDIPGVRERWGRDLLHCPYCHGWEVRDQPLGVLGAGPGSVQHALLVRQWSDDVAFFVHTYDLSSAERAQLEARDIKTVTGEVARLVAEPDWLRGVELVDGRVVAVTAVFVRPGNVAHAGDLLAGLGCEVNEAGFAKVDATGRTSVPGVWAAGNVADPRAQVITAAGAGSAAAIAINADLVDEDVERALERHDAASSVTSAAPETLATRALARAHLRQ